MKEIKKTEKDGYIEIEFDNGTIIKEALAESIEAIEPPPTTEQLVMQTLADMEIATYEQAERDNQAHVERTILAQTITELELLILEGGM